MITKIIESDETVNTKDSTSIKPIFSFTEVLANEIELAKLPLLSKSSSKLSRKNSKSIGISLVIERPQTS